MEDGYGLKTGIYHKEACLTEPIREKNHKEYSNFIEWEKPSKRNANNSCRFYKPNLRERVRLWWEQI